MAVVGGSTGLELWSGEDWDYKERAEGLQQQLDKERAARSSAEARVRLLEQVSESDLRHFLEAFRCLLNGFGWPFGWVLG